MKIINSTLQFLYILGSVCGRIDKVAIIVQGEEDIYKYQNTNYFQNVFRKQTGMTPAQFAHQPEIDETAPSSL